MFEGAKRVPRPVVFDLVNVPTLNVETPESLSSRVQFFTKKTYGNSPPPRDQARMKVKTSIRFDKKQLLPSLAAMVAGWRGGWLAGWLGARW